jgi:LUD domain
MEKLKEYDEVASIEVMTATAEALRINGMNVTIVENAEEAKAEALKLIPEGSRVMTMTSVTLTTLGLAEIIDDSGKYVSVRDDLANAEGAHKRELGAAPDFTIGSVHAISSKGEVIIASNTGSQLPAYAYGAEKVIWLVGGQKLAGSMEDAMRRVYDYVLPLESKRAHEAYGVEGSNVSKMLIINKENIPDRINIILIQESHGF